MLKKAGIVVATAAAGLLAVSPLAFAGDKGYDHDDRNGSHHYGHDDDDDGDKFIKIIEGDDIDVDQDGDGGNNACKNDQEGDTTGSLLGIGSLLNNTSALNCLNVLNNNLNDNDVDVDVL